jgi:acetyl-CoA carboxylase biotin carboxylase subunit/3-methylcrotonyl-CoA carboxylase alpha subunit
MFRKVLIANRGEIARRVIRTCRRLGIATVAVHSDADRDAPHVREADQAIGIGPAPVRDSYLNVAALVAAVRASGADAVHPGYGLLSESADFARAVAAAGATFIGPPPDALELFGDKIRARARARASGVEPPPGSDGTLDPADAERLASEAERIGYPVLIKAAAGGGGIGMQIVRKADELVRAAQTCSDRGRAAFGDPRVYLERYLDRPRHIEVQIFRDATGASVALGERECSAQRRHQKVIEESPSPAHFLAGEAGATRRADLFARARRIVDDAGYLGAGTVEFVADAAGRLWFLEVNARLQVEHPVTELTTGLDLVELQLRVAAGEPLPREVLDVHASGHAIEARLYAEDPAKGFAPQPGRVVRLVWPDRPGVRVDAGIETGSEVTVHYDPMLAKIIAAGSSRQDAIAALDAALAELEIELVGPKGPRQTNRELLRCILGSSAFQSGDYDTGLLATLVGTK